MRQFSATEEIPGEMRGACLALGNFDGVHRGHQVVIATARARAEALSAPLAVAVFEPHPRRFFQPDAPPYRLQSANQRARALAALGANAVFEIAFDGNLSGKTDLEFARDIIAHRLGARHVSIGADFRFGRGRMGDAESLRHAGEGLGFTVDAHEDVRIAGARVSSTAIRAHIALGEVDKAANLLTRPWAIEGIVQKGFQRGREIGVPTANVSLGDYTRPKLGIYAVRAEIGDMRLHPGVASIGLNPTVGALQAPLLETHLFDFGGDLYERTIEVQLIAYLRPEAKFEDMQAMARQIEADIARARALLV